MSKSPVVLKNNNSKKELTKNTVSPTIYSSNNLPYVREANVPARAEDNKSIITAYKDLDQPAKDFALNQKRHLLIAFLVFFALGIGIMMGQKKNRGLATAEMQKLIPENAVPTANEHYLYEKSCYKGSSGEDVCVTRSSRKNN